MSAYQSTCEIAEDSALPVVVIFTIGLEPLPSTYTSVLTRCSPQACRGDSVDPLWGLKRLEACMQQ